MLEHKRGSSIFVIKQYILFIHAWSGCDSISAIFGKGKPSFFKLLSKSLSIKAVAETISDYWATQEEVNEASLNMFKEQYGGKASYMLKKMRYAFII